MMIIIPLDLQRRSSPTPWLGYIARLPRRGNAVHRRGGRSAV